MEAETTEGNASSVLAIKRKADEAFDVLDEALQVRPRQTRPSPVKRPNVSFYSSLTKHGIATKPKIKPSVSTPTLSALLNRARSKKDIKSQPINPQTKMSSIAPEYSPGSTEVFLERLSTFNLSTYTSKPQPIDAVAAAMAGWINEGGKNRLFCSLCHAGWIVTGREGLSSKEAGEALVEKQADCLINNHKEGCPWRSRQCDPLVYRIPLYPPGNMAKEVKEQADRLEPLMEGISVRHPLSTSQVTSFMQTITAVASKPSSSARSTFTNGLQQTNSTLAAKVPSATSLLTVLFGWTLSLPAPVIIRKPSAVSLAQARNQSFSRASSVVPSTAVSRDITPAPTIELGTSPPTTPTRTQFRPATSPFPSTPSNTDVKRSTIKDATLQCKMCQRRIGLWSFAMAAAESPDYSSFQLHGAPLHGVQPLQRQLDLIKEHRSYCPYVVKSTPLATLPLYGSTHPPHNAQSDNAPFTLTRADTFAFEKTTGGFQKPALFRSATIFPMGRSISHGRSNSMPPILQNLQLVEGWRAVYNTILRYGISERAGQPTETRGSQELESTGPGSSHVADTPEADDEDDAMRGVTRLVEDVKRHGGKQILAYVKNLLS